MDDDFERLRRAVDSPAGRALLSAAALTGFFIFAGKALSDPKARKSYVSQVRQAWKDRGERDAWHERKTARIHAKWDYFKEVGDKLWAKRALITIGPEKPFRDAVYETQRAGFRHTAFRVQSRQARAKIEVGYDVADRDGSITLTFEDGQRWALGISAGQHDLRQYDSRKTLPDETMVRFACRLLATPGSAFSTITLIRPESREIREQIWRDHVAKHPELEEEPWTF